jgi:hypothetical protein
MSIDTDNKRNKWVARKIVVTLTDKQNEQLEKLLADRRQSNPRESIVSIMQEAFTNLYRMQYDGDNS